MLEAKNITKQFSGVTALSDVSLVLHPGKVNAIIGENGAGKSTLMKILSGVYTQYEGTLLLDNQPIQFENTREAEAAGIVIIHQELNLVPYLNIVENIFLGRELTNGLGILDEAQMLSKAKDLLNKVQLHIDPYTKIAALKVGQQQLVEIAKALYSDAAVIIMDEPTSAISDKEVTQLFSIIDQLKTAGKTIVYISHKLKELFAIADHYVVLRDGKTVDAGEMQSITQDGLIQKMTGRELSYERKGKSNTQADTILEVSHFCLQHPDFKSTNLVEDVSFRLGKGEILGLYGLMGAGRTELLEGIFGLHPHQVSGEIKVDGKICSIQSPTDAIATGIALVPEDRKLQGLLLDQSISRNISLTVLEQLEKWGILLSSQKENDLTTSYIQSLSIKTSSALNLAKNLSGGNQQKIVLAKWLATKPLVLLLDEPTRGVDIHAKTEIYKIMKSLANAGMGILMASSELPEILAVSDRVMILCEGTCTATLPIEEATEAGILKFAIHKNELVS